MPKNSDGIPDIVLYSMYNMVMSGLSEQSNHLKSSELSVNPLQQQ